MADTSEIDAALVAKLGGDAQLAALMQPGAFVFMDEAPPGSQKYVIVSRIQAFDVPMFGARAYEDHLYLVEARMLSTAGGNMKAAAKRIDELLDDQPLSIVGYTLMTLQREEPVRFPETDDLDPTIKWFHRGGRYRLLAST